MERDVPSSSRGRENRAGISWKRDGFNVVRLNLSFIEKIVNVFDLWINFQCRYLIVDQKQQYFVVITILDTFDFQWLNEFINICSSNSSSHLLIVLGRSNSVNSDFLEKTLAMCKIIVSRISFSREKNEEGVNVVVPRN